MHSPEVMTGELQLLQAAFQHGGVWHRHTPFPRSDWLCFRGPASRGLGPCLGTAAAWRCFALQLIAQEGHGRLQEPVFHTNLTIFTLFWKTELFAPAWNLTEQDILLKAPQNRGERIRFLTAWQSKMPIQGFNIHTALQIIYMSNKTFHLVSVR